MKKGIYHVIAYNFFIILFFIKKRKTYEEYGDINILFLGFFQIFFSLITTSIYSKNVNYNY